MEVNWQDLSKTAYLYELQSGSNIELMLKRTDTNSRQNEKLARFCCWLNAATGNWEGNYKHLWGDLPVKLQEYYLNMDDGYARKQAIEMAGLMARAEAAQAGSEGQVMKRGGLLGLLGIK